MDQDHVQPPQPPQPDQTGVPASIPGPGQAAPPPQGRFGPPQPPQQPPHLAGPPGPAPQAAPPPQTQPPVQSPAEQFRGYVTGRLRAGTPKADVVTDLVNRGIDQSQAIQLVNSIDVGVVQPAKAEEVTGTGLVGAIVGAALAAVIGGVVWGLIAAKVGYEVGWIAWGIGVLSGFAVVLASGGKRGTAFQAIAVAGSLLGIFFGKYLTFYFLLKEYIQELAADAVAEAGAEVAVKISLFSAEVFQDFLSSVGELLGLLDILFVFLAIASAWRIAKPVSAAGAD